VNTRPTRARLTSLCGTARRLAKEEKSAGHHRARRKPCRYAAIWSCAKSLDCVQRMEAQRR
jgi:hypothetical protein